MHIAGQRHDVMTIHGYDIGRGWMDPCGLSSRGGMDIGGWLLRYLHVSGMEDMQYFLDLLPLLCTEEKWRLLCRATE
jgi:hypothetical protein